MFLSGMPNWVVPKVKRTDRGKFVFRTAALVAALAVAPISVFTGCEFNGIDGLSGSQTASLRFSGSSQNTNDSVIDMIRLAKSRKAPALSFSLCSGSPQEVRFDDKTDLSIRGLRLDRDNSPAEVTINGGNQTVRLTGDPVKKPAPLITVGDGVTLTLRNIAFRGLSNNNAPLILVADGGTLVLKPGAVITGNTNSDGTGGVVVESGGSLIMDGGTVSKNKAAGGNNGGGVRVDPGGIFTMNSGIIGGNDAQSGGGVYVEGSFIMCDGTISNNKANGNDDYNGYGGGVYMTGGTFSMMSGTISDNSANNIGGGVQINGAAFAIYGGAIISGNEAKNGGGVYTNGSFKIDSGLIKENRVKTPDSTGGGVYVSGSFTMDGGTINGNSTNPNQSYVPNHVFTLNGGFGAGVYVEYYVDDFGEYDGTSSKTGGTVSGLIKEKKTEWEDIEYQNYYAWEVHGNNWEEAQAHYVGYYDTEKHRPIGKKKGYVVYY
jgi:hypothetical protein